MAISGKPRRRARRCRSLTSSRTLPKSGSLMRLALNVGTVGGFDEVRPRVVVRDIFATSRSPQGVRFQQAADRPLWTARACQYAAGVEKLCQLSNQLFDLPRLADRSSPAPCQPRWRRLHLRRCHPRAGRASAFMWARTSSRLRLQVGLVSLASRSSTSFQVRLGFSCTTDLLTGMPPLAKRRDAACQMLTVRGSRPRSHRFGVGETAAPSRAPRRAAADC